MMRIAWGVDHDYVETLGLSVVAGRDFSLFAPADTNARVLNEAAARLLALQDPVGRVLRWGDYAGPIVGIVEDFHFASLHSEIEPLVIPLRPDVGGRLLVRILPDRTEDALAYVQARFDDLVPNQIFRYTFVEDAFDALYRDEDKLSDVFGYFSAIAIFIACLGLFGLAAFSAGQRTKEIGVRKVLGASIPNLVIMISKDFAGLVIVAFIIAVPLTYAAMSRWLADFAYRIDIRGSEFLIAGLAALVIALMTVSYQSIKAAVANPVKSLRVE